MEPTPTVQLTDDEWRARLSPERYAILRQAATEPAGSGSLLYVDAEGTYT